MTYLKRLFEQRTIRYIFFGGCTTLVDIVFYAMFHHFLGIDMSTSNFLSIMIAIVFAYVVNKWFVFQSRTKGFKSTIKEGVSFIGMRLTTMAIQIYGMVLLCSIWGMNDMVAKILIQFVVLILNYIISKVFVFKDGKDIEDSYAKSQWKKSQKWCFILAFFIPIAVIMVGFIRNGVYPFGDHGILIIDSAHQYLPFFTELLRKLREGESLLYTFHGGMGINFWGLIAYYLSSPLNILLLLFKEDFVMEAMAMLILLKIGLSGGFFAFYLSRKSKKSNLTVVACSIMFALSNFMIGYYFNIMWLDSIMLLPLIMMGIEKIAAGKSGRLYGGVLALVLFCNYYIGFMICIFSCCYFVIQFIIGKKQKVSEFFKKCISFGGYSLLAGAMAGIMLVPAFRSLSISQSMTDPDVFPKTIKVYTSWLKLFSQHFMMLEPINISDEQGDLNVYFGVAVILLVILYALDKKIHLRERIVKILFCVFLFLSFNINILNFIWHDFHVQNGLPNRFAFLYIGMLVTMIFDVCQDIKSISIKRVGIAAFLSIGIGEISSFFRIGDHHYYVYVLTLIFLCLYTILFFLYRVIDMKKFYFQLAFFVLVVIELSVNGIYGTIQNGTIGRSAYLNDKNNFKELLSKTNDDTFYRSEMDDTLIRNEIMYQGGNGIVMFSSTVPGDMIHFIRKLGMEGRTNKSGYPGATKLVNDMLGIRYVVSKTNTDILFGLPKVDEEENLSLYKNETALSLGYMVNRNIKEWNIDEKSHTQVQDDFIELATGQKGIYQRAHSYEITETGSLVFTILPGEHLYLDLEDEVEKVTINAPTYKREYDKYTDHLYDLGSYDQVTDVTVEFEVEEGNEEKISMATYGYQEKEYDRVIEALSKNQMEIISQEADRVQGKIQVDKAGTLLLTVPYEDGWKIVVDGKEVEKYPVGKALIGIDLEAGNHQIEMKFTPEGLYLGSALSVTGVVCFLLFVLFERKFLLKQGQPIDKKLEER